MSATMPKFTCDGCGRDVTTSSNYLDYRLALTAECMDNIPGTAVSMAHITPPIDRSKHFCNINCLRNWVRSIPIVTPFISDAARSVSGLVGGE